MFILMSSWLLFKRIFSALKRSRSPRVKACWLGPSQLEHETWMRKFMNFEFQLIKIDTLESMQDFYSASEREKLFWELCYCQCYCHVIVSELRDKFTSNLVNVKSIKHAQPEQRKLADRAVAIKTAWNGSEYLLKSIIFVSVYSIISLDVLMFQPSGADSPSFMQSLNILERMCIAVKRTRWSAPNQGLPQGINQQTLIA